MGKCLKWQRKDGYWRCFIIKDNKRNEFRVDESKAFSLEYFDMDALHKDSFSEYGIIRFWPDIQGQIWTIIMPEKRPEALEEQKSKNGNSYSGYNGAGNTNMVKSGSDSEERFDESWSMENTAIAGYTLSGGTNAGPLDNVTGKNTGIEIFGGIDFINCRGLFVKVPEVIQ